MARDVPDAVRQSVSGVDSVTWRALARESALVAEHLGLGATVLGKANSDRVANYAQAFFALSVGLERGAKVALTLEAVLTDGAFLAPDRLKSYGHDLVGLLREVRRIGEERGVEAEFPDDSISRAVRRTLGDFAKNVNRYYNLEALADESGRRGQDPIEAWHRNVTQPVLADHYTEQQRAQDAARAEVVGVPANMFVSIIHTSELGEPIRDLQKLRLHSAASDRARPWERMYVLRHARFLGKTIARLGDEVQHLGIEVPYLEEFFQVFFVDDRDFRERIQWTIH